MADVDLMLDCTLDDEGGEPTRIIHIIKLRDNHFNVVEGDRVCIALGWDELVGSIAELTHPKIGKPRYRMLTREEHQADRQRHLARIAEQNGDK